MGLGTGESRAVFCVIAQDLLFASWTGGSPFFFHPFKDQNFIYQLTAAEPAVDSATLF